MISGSNDVNIATLEKIVYAFVNGVHHTFLIPTDVAIPGDTLKPSS